MGRASQPEAQERRSIGGGSRAEKPRESACDLRIERNDGVIDLVKAEHETPWRSVPTAAAKFDRYRVNMCLLQSILCA